MFPGSFRELKIIEFLAFPSWDLAVEQLENPHASARGCEKVPPLPDGGA